MVVEKKSQIRQDELDSRYVTVYLCSSEKKIVRDFHHMEKDFGDLTINIYLWIMLYAVVLWLISFCLKIFWILFFHSFPDRYWCLIEKFLSKCKCTQEFIFYKYSPNLPKYCYRRMILRHMIIRDLIAVYYLLCGSDSIKKLN